MLGSTKEYLQALREKKYLVFLDWPQFVAEHYKDVTPQDADTMLNLLIFEWLNDGYSQSDVILVAFLYAVSKTNSGLLQSNLGYAFTSIVIAALQCMAYHSNNLHLSLLSSEKISSTQINKLVNNAVGNLNKSTFEGILLVQQDKFFTWVGDVDELEAQKTGNKISLITDLRYLTEQYITDLERTTIIDDLLKPARLSLIRRLAQYLNEQYEMTPSVKEEVGVYVNKIREMQPALFEEDYLLNLSPLSFIGNTWRMVTGLGLGFFSLMQPPQSAQEQPKSEETLNT